MNRLFTADEVLRIGLLCAGFDSSRQVRVQRTTNERRFQSYYGSSPLVCSAIWEDLITNTKEDQTPHPPKSATFDKFLLALYFLKEYPTEEKLAGMWHTCEKSARQWVWFFVGRIQALKAKKVVWPEAWSSCNETYLYSVDGVHCRINELIHPTQAKNTKLYSHKFHQAGLDYELAISIRESRLVWINGPFDASTHDVTVFRQQLKQMTPLDKNGIADQGYRGEKSILCTPNPHDTHTLQKFKTRARLRHETFNARIKFFACLDERFRHGRDAHKQCFEAICVIAQYQMENGAPLFDM